MNYNGVLVLGRDGFLTEPMHTGPMPLAEHARRRKTRFDPHGFDQLLQENLRACQ